MATTTAEPKICLALGGGAARGLAHLGVLTVLEEAGIPLHMITGTSFGALIGGLYATRPDARYWTERVNAFLHDSRSRMASLEFIRRMEEPEIHPGFITDMAHLIRKGYFWGMTAARPAFISEEEYEELIYPLVPDIAIEESKIPFGCVATDLRHGKRAYFIRGPLRKAVCASCALPGIFPPVIDDDMLLVDGGWVERSPVRCARTMGAEIVIAVDVSRDIPLFEGKSGLDIILRADAVARLHLNEFLMQEADLVVRPAISDIHWADFSNPKEIYRRGETAAKETLPAIRKLLQQGALPREGLVDRIRSFLGMGKKG